MEESFVLVERERQRESRSRGSSIAAESSNTSRRAATIVDFDIANIVDDYRSHTARARRTDNPAHRDTWTTDLGFDGCSAKNRSVVVHYLSRHQTTDPASSLPFGKPPSTSAQAAATPWRPSSPVARPVPAPPLHRPHTHAHTPTTPSQTEAAAETQAPQMSDVKSLAKSLSAHPPDGRHARFHTLTHTHPYKHYATRRQCRAAQRNAPSGRSFPHRTRHCGYARRLDARPSTADVCRSATKGLYPDRWRLACSSSPMTT
ncbi:hypothetical protein CH63R_02927 [Colletotrichum higginsianum IMI 349063]|uniref:Uncharacterized protein n=1 Tax=Colletotrichum higginsianum (strain IMI 349063) TaxID=759273 RepID=A0A1B7YQ88_COLHI|nr:hypothetical protein CH63R_02927 [Colletotrichum higginsianum IMI 349063]OBR14201.1 hypothetical protein CH63R_02927 [Colletotrichum higginsianum IMI 349063]